MDRDGARGPPEDGEKKKMLPHTQFPSGTCLGEWRKNQLKKSAQLLMTEEATERYTYLPVPKVLTTVLGPNILRSI